MVKLTCEKNVFKNLSVDKNEEISFSHALETIDEMQYAHKMFKYDVCLTYASKMLWYDK